MCRNSRKLPRDDIVQNHGWTDETEDEYSEEIVRWGSDGFANAGWLVEERKAMNRPPLYDYL